MFIIIPAFAAVIVIVNGNGINPTTEWQTGEDYVLEPWQCEVGGNFTIVWVIIEMESKGTPTQLHYPRHESDTRELFGGHVCNDDDNDQLNACSSSDYKYLTHRGTLVVANITEAGKYIVNITTTCGQGNESLITNHSVIVRIFNDTRVHPNLYFTHLSYGNSAWTCVTVCHCRKGIARTILPLNAHGQLFSPRGFVMPGYQDAHHNHQPQTLSLATFTMHSNEYAVIMCICMMPKGEDDVITYRTLYDDYLQRRAHELMVRSHKGLLCPKPAISIGPLLNDEYEDYEDDVTTPAATTPSHIDTGLASQDCTFAVTTASTVAIIMTVVSCLLCLYGKEYAINYVL